MQRPKRRRLWPVWLYARRCLLYNCALSLLGTGALFAFVLSTSNPEETLEEPVLRAARIASVLGPILIMTAGHTLGVLAMRYFHGREIPYYLNARIGEVGLGLVSWAVALAAGFVALASRLLWT